jgi:hypothetical protein
MAAAGRREEERGGTAGPMFWPPYCQTLCQPIVTLQPWLTNLIGSCSGVDWFSHFTASREIIASSGIEASESSGFGFGINVLATILSKLCQPIVTLQP